MNSGLLPCCPCAEEAMLGCFALEPSVVGSVLCENGVTEEHFYEPRHRELFAAMLGLWKDGKPVDVLTLPERLREKGRLDAAGGWEEVVRILSCVPSAGVLEQCLEPVLHAKLSRDMLALCRRISERVMTEQDDVPGVLSALIGEANRIGVIPKKQVRLKDVVMAKLDRMQCGQVDDDLVQTGLTDLDKASPMRLGDMILVSGERKSGKSMLGLNIMLNAALAGNHGALFSLEDKLPKIVDRLISAKARVPMSYTHESHFKEQGDLDRFSDGALKVAGLPLEAFDDRLDLASVTGTLRRLKAQTPDLRLAMIDYAQLVRAGLKRKDASREQEVAEVSRSIRLLAMELNVAVLLLSQLNEDGKSRESRALEMDCTARWDVVVDKEEPNRRFLNIPFQRNGESSIGFWLTFHGALAKFDNYENDQADRNPATGNGRNHHAASRNYRSRYADD